MYKILHVITDTNIGGAGRVLLNYLANYDRNAFAITVALPPNSLLEPLIERLDVPCIEVDGIADKSFSMKSIMRLRELMDNLTPDLVHTHASLSARIAARMYKRCKLIYTRHCCFDQPAYKKRFPMKQLAGAVNNYFADKIIAISPAAKENIVETGGDPDKIIVMLNGIVPITPFTDAEKTVARQKYGLANNDFVCAILARLTKVKGHEQIIQAAAMFQKIDPAVKFLIVGMGEEETALREMVETLQLNNSIFTGFIDDVREILGMIDLQLNASYGTETSSLSLLEGMCLGIPAVASDFGGNPYLIQNGENGLLFERKNANDLFEKISKIRNDATLRAQMAESAVAIFNERFTVKHMATNIENVYREVLADGK